MEDVPLLPPLLLSKEDAGDFLLEKFFLLCTGDEKISNFARSVPWSKLILESKLTRPLEPVESNESLRLIKALLGRLLESCLGEESVNGSLAMVADGAFSSPLRNMSRMGCSVSSW